MLEKSKQILSTKNIHTEKKSKLNYLPKMIAN